MRVTHVITRLIVGGAQENTVATVVGLHGKKGIEVDLISGPTTGPEGSLEPDLLQRKVPFAVVPSLVRPVSPANDWKALRELTDIFKSKKPDIVHTHSGKAGILGRLAAQKAGVPMIIHTIHGPSFGSFQGAVSNFIFREAERYAARCTTHFIVVANAMTEQYLAAGIGKPEQYTRIFSGFNLQPFLEAKNDLLLREELGFAPDDFVVGKIGRLVDLKGHDDLFDIAPRLVSACPQMKFLLVGDGPWREKFKKQARDSKLEKHFVFTGLVPPAEVPKYIGVMDALVHLSRREGLPRALPQALAAARPVVAIDCDGAREVCLDGRTGYLIAPNDLKTLSEKLLSLAADKSLRERLGQQGQTFVRELFPVERMVDEIHTLYQRLA